MKGISRTRVENYDKKNISMYFILFLLLLLFGSSACLQTNQDLHSKVEKQTDFLIENMYTEPLSPIPDESFNLIVNLANHGNKKEIYNAVLNIVEIEG